MRNSDVYKKKKLMPFLVFENSGCNIVVSEPDFKSSKGKCALESLVQSRLEHSQSCVVGYVVGCFESSMRYA